MIKIIGDPGSCHMGDKKKAKELVKIGADCGLDAVKFQLLTHKEAVGGNIELDWDWLPELIELGELLKIEVFASVFDQNGIKWLYNCGCKSIKFPYSKQFLKILCWEGLIVNGKPKKKNVTFENVYRSSGVMDKQDPSVINLFCIPEYPVPYFINFSGFFPRFQGFSSHCMGMGEEMRAIEAGAQVLEVHFKGPWEADCPDALFAKSPDLLDKLCKHCAAL